MIKFSINFDKEFHKKLKIYCANCGISIKDYIVSLIKKDMNKDNKKK